MQISLKMPSRMLIVGVIALLLSCLGLMTSVSSAAATTAAPTVAYIDVSVATLWTQPRLNRPVDQPSISNPVDLAAWTKKMTLNQRLDLVGDLETQALYGQRVLITDTSGDWVKVVVPDQSTPRDARGYPGWLPKSQLVTDAAFAAISDHPFAVVTKPTAWLYQDQHRSKRFMELSFNTRLPVLDRSHGSILVATPHEDSKWLAAADSTVYDSESEIPKPTGKDLVRTAKLFTGLPYLWAGMSGWGYDCSGFTYNLYRAHGIAIARDAQDQAVQGVPVAKQQLRPGDLLFYAQNGGVGSIHHVGMYIGDGDEIDAPINTATTDSGVEIVKVDQHRYANEYAGARRYLPST